MIFLFYPIVTLLFHYFSGYWLNEQCRDPRYAPHLIEMNMRKANSLWRRLLILGQSRLADIVAEAAIMQIAGLIWCAVELLLALVNALHPFDAALTVLMWLFYIEASLGIIFVLYVSISYERKKNADRK